MKISACPYVLIGLMSISLSILQIEKCQDTKDCWCQKNDVRLRRLRSWGQNNQTVRRIYLLYKYYWLHTLKD